MPKTKIICTIGPACSSLETITDLVKAGMNVARLNFSHGTHEEHARSIALIKEARKQLGIPLAILLDTKGPEVRLGKIKGGQLEVHPGQHIFLTKKKVEGDSERISITPGSIISAIPIGATLLIDNGYISSTVIDTADDGITIEITNKGILSSSKGINIPNVDLPMAPLTDNDFNDIRFGCQNDIDILALSFVRDAETCLIVKKLLQEEGKPDIQVIAKIEDPQGVNNFDSILEVADGIMVARGDLGVEVPLSSLPRLQKMMLKKSCLAGKPAIVATQMLESMICHPRPTRAEVLDVANAIYDSAAGVMLSGETAVGKYPVETVRTMQTIIKEAEEDFSYTSFFEQHSNLTYTDVPHAITLSAVQTAYSLDAKAIFTFTKLGTTARLLSRLKPKMPILAFTPSESTFHQLALQWGVTPILCPPYKTIEEALREAGRFTLNQGLMRLGDLVVLAVGYPLWICGMTSTILVEHIGGDVLLKGVAGKGAATHGKVVLIQKRHSKSPYHVRESIVVTKEFDDSLIPLLEEAAGIILQNDINDTESEKRAKKAAEKLDKPIITRANGAFRILREGQYVTLDPKHALVYKGIVESLTTHAT